MIKKVELDLSSNKIAVKLKVQVSITFHLIMKTFSNNKKSNKRSHLVPFSSE